jgi:hypothetical protein
MTNNIVAGIEINNIRAELHQLGADLAYAIEGHLDDLAVLIDQAMVRLEARLSFLRFGHLGGF